MWYVDFIKSKTFADHRRRLASGALIALGLALVLLAVGGWRRDTRHDATALSEYAGLRELSLVNGLHPAVVPIVRTSKSTEESEHEFSLAVEVTQSLTDMNPDYVGWITIPGTAVSYPVVRGRDNDQYMHITFSGSYNPAGSIFMDYRCTDDFDTPMSLIYGHNMRNDSMFSPLVRYLDADFMAAHPEIHVVSVSGEKRVYRIAEARLTDAWDEVYTLDVFDAFEAAELFPGWDVGKLMVLSTCVDSPDRTGRLLVFAVCD